MPVVLSIALVLFATAEVVGHRVPMFMLGYVVCGVYVLFAIAIDISIAMQKKTRAGGHSYQFNPACVVLLVEALKLALSALLHVFSVWYSRRYSATTRVPLFSLPLGDVKWLLLPAIFFTANNIIVFLAIGRNELSTFAVFQVAAVFWAAVFWKCVFKADLGWARICGTALVLAALVINRIPSMVHRDSSTPGWAWLLLLSFANAAGSVANEYALKRHRALDINIQNMVLYSGCAFCCFVYLLGSDAARISGGPAAFFRGFEATTWVTAGMQASIGLLVGRMLKHADAVMKTVSVSWRGPLVVLVSPAFVHTGRPSWPAVLSSVVASLGCSLYFTMGPLESQVEADPGRGGARKV